jgi:hypothetical protein
MKFFSGLESMNFSKNVGKKFCLPPYHCLFNPTEFIQAHTKIVLQQQHCFVHCKKRIFAWKCKQCHFLCYDYVPNIFLHWFFFLSFCLVEEKYFDLWHYKFQNDISIFPTYILFCFRIFVSTFITICLDIFMWHTYFSFFVCSGRSTTVMGPFCV